MAQQPQAQIKPRATPPPMMPPSPEELIAQLRDIVAAQSGVIRAQATYIVSLVELLELPQPPPGP